MQYLIGGAARAGKTLLAQRMLREHQHFGVSEGFLPVLEQAYETLCVPIASKAPGGQGL